MTELDEFKLLGFDFLDEVDLERTKQFSGPGELGFGGPPCYFALPPEGAEPEPPTLKRWIARWNAFEFCSKEDEHNFIIAAYKDADFPDTADLATILRHVDGWDAGSFSKFETVVRVWTKYQADFGFPILTD